MNQVVGDVHWRPLHLVILLLYGVFLTWPALSNGYIPSRDVLIHLLWSSNFSQQLWAGEWYPRWLDGMNGGLGSPVFFFYPPLPYYFTALLKPFFHADPEGWHQLGTAASMAVIVSGFSAYGWLRKIGGATAALVAAIVYMSAPYHLAFDLYQRFAFAELWSFVWLPLVLWGIQATVAGGRKALVGLTLAYAALLLTHLPTAMIFSPVALAYAVFCADRRGWMRDIMAVAGAMALGVGLAATFLVPALSTQNNVSLSDMRVGHFSYIYHFLFYGPRSTADFMTLLVQQGRYSIVMMIACMAAFISHGRALAWAKMRQTFFWLVIAVLVFAMMLPIARPLWDILPPLQAIQFPWRFNILLTLAMTALIALWVASIKPEGSRFSRLSLLIVCVVVVGQSLPSLVIYRAMVATPGRPSMDKMFAQFGSLNNDTKEKVLAAKLAADVEEYRPRWVPHAVFHSSQALGGLLARVQAEHQGSGTVTTLSRSPRRIVLSVDIPAEGWVKLPHFYYPGWRAMTGSPATQLPLRPLVQEGLLEVSVKPGRHEIVLELMTSRAEWIGWAISSVSVVLLGLLTFLAFRRRELPLRFNSQPNGIKDFR